jgi:hypothetical protein
MAAPRFRSPISRAAEHKRSGHVFEPPFEVCRPKLHAITPIGLPNRRADGKHAIAHQANIVGLSSRLISMITSAGMLLRFAALRIASALGASYKQ